MKATTFFMERCVIVASQVWENTPINQKQTTEMNSYRKRKHNELLI